MSLTLPKEYVGPERELVEGELFWRAAILVRSDAIFVGSYRRDSRLDDEEDAPTFEKYVLIDLISDLQDLFEQFTRDLAAIGQKTRPVLTRLSDLLRLECPRCANETLIPVAKGHHSGFKCSNCSPNDLILGPDYLQLAIMRKLQEEYESS